MATYEHALRAARRQLTRAALLAGATVLALLIGSNFSSAYATGTTWSFRSIDNMHAARDYPCWPQSTAFMTSVATAERTAHANYASVPTPYDAASNYRYCTPPDPIGYEQQWVQALRAQGLHVWFRQTWFNWEGSYKAPKLTATTSPAIPLGTAANVLNGTDTTSYLAKTYRFILAHPGLYANGDIMTPESEPQNGGIAASWGQCGSGLCQFSGWPRLNQWLRDSMTVDSAAFRHLGLQVTVGYWGLPCSNNRWNGVNNIEASTIQQMGVFVTDCYFHDVPTLVSRLQLIHSTYSTNVIVGEWGDIWDDGVQPTTANEISSAMTAVQGLPYVTGFNYWQGWGSGTGEGLINPTSLKLNASGLVVQRRF
jgi:hypothetical protein